MIHAWLARVHVSPASAVWCGCAGHAGVALCRLFMYMYLLRVVWPSSSSTYAWAGAIGWLLMLEVHVLLGCCQDVHGSLLVQQLLLSLQPGVRRVDCMALHSVAPRPLVPVLGLRPSTTQRDRVVV
jgi:hypothetical protein